MTTSPIRVLVVDDDQAITEIYTEVLTGHGYSVLAAGGCAEAMKQMDSVQGNVQVLIVDFGLPDCDGADFVRDAVAKYGERATVYVSGWSDEFWQLQNTPGRWIIMRKPVPLKKLLAAVKWLALGGDKPRELDD